MHGSGEAIGRSGKTPPLERYVRILEVLASFPAGATPVEIANILRLPRASAHRLLKSMQDSHIVECLPPNRYTVGARIRRLIFLGADMQWMDALIRPMLHELAEKIGDTCYIGKLDSDRIVSVMMESPASSWRGFVIQGRDFPPHAAAGAKAILAFQPGEIVDQILAPDLPALTRFTRTTPEQVKAEYVSIRSSGYAVCLGEIEEELIGVAVPIHAPGIGVSYSLGMTGPKSRLIKKGLDEIAAQLQPVADHVGMTIAKGLSMPMGLSAGSIQDAAE